MCGIAGLVGQNVPDRKRIDTTLALMRRRGPDAQASRTARSAAGTSATLLHSRLTILDLDPRSNQPMRLGTKWLVFNGELYNFIELRQELVSGGHHFQTTGDSEVLLHALDAWGVDGLDRCEGMWAFALYDEADGSLILARDRFGEKPLYWRRTGGDVVFGSEAKFLASLDGVPAEPDLRQLRRYMVGGYRTLFKQDGGFLAGVARVPAGGIIRFAADGTSSTQRYWTPEYLERDERLSYDDAVAEARAALERSLRLRLRSDVPLAFCLSGGIDSTALVSLAKSVFGYDVHGFTVANTDQDYDERGMVAETVRQLGIRHSWVPVETQDFLGRLKTLVRQHDAPVATITFYAHWRMMEMVAEQGYKIALSGTGADELFSGYWDHHVAYLYEARCDPELYARRLEEWQRHVVPLVLNPFFRDPDLFLKNPLDRRYLYVDAEAMARHLKTPWHEPFTETAFCDDVLRNRMFNELFHESVPCFLHEEDLNAMYFSVENRSPFLDRQLFDLCARVPSRHLVRDGMAKAILRDAVRDVAPAHVLDCRRKVGFNAPLDAFLDRRSAEVRSYLLDGGAVYDYVRRESIETLLAKDRLGGAEAAFLFAFVNAKTFLDMLEQS